jgi:teichuronic acid biosynthesis glycosyltransferase TuaC
MYKNHKKQTFYPIETSIDILVVCSGNASNFIFEINQAFIYDQVKAIESLKLPIKFDYYFIKGKGITGYLNNLKKIKEKIKIKKYHLIHAHFGDSVMLSNLQRTVPVVGTYHGSDLNKSFDCIISNISNILSRHSITVSKKLYQKLLFKKRLCLIPCGVDFHNFFPIEKKKAREEMGIPSNKTVILFSSSFNNEVKNFQLAKKAINILKNSNILTIELNGYTRKQINTLMNASDVALLTSFTEGSPQFIKEAMACNCPVVSTDVGDVKDNIKGTKGCFITTYNPVDVASKLKEALDFGEVRTNGRERVLFLDNTILAKQVVDVYYKAISKL